MLELTWPLYIVMAILVAIAATFILTYFSDDDKPDSFTAFMGILCGAFWFAAIPGIVIAFVSIYLINYVSKLAIHLRDNGFKKPVKKVEIKDPNLKWDGDIS